MGYNLSFGWNYKILINLFMILNNLSLTIQDLLVLFDRIALPIYIYRCYYGEIYLIHRNNTAYDFDNSDIFKASRLKVKYEELYIDNKSIIEDLHRCINQKIRFSRIGYMVESGKKDTTIIRWYY